MASLKSRSRDSLDVMREPLAEHGDVLDTRSRGEDVRWQIERKIAACSDSEALVLDFAGVRAVTVPFIEASVGQLLAGRMTGYYENHPVLAVNANDDVRGTLSLTLSHHRLALLYLGDPPVLLGGDPILNETLQQAWELRQFSALDIAQRLHVSPQAANNRLKALVGRGALRRVLIVPPGGGKEFVYAVPEEEPGNAEENVTPGQSDERAVPA
jgi:hypothetical protein